MVQNRYFFVIFLILKKSYKSLNVLLSATMFARVMQVDTSFKTSNNIDGIEKADGSGPSLDKIMTYNNGLNPLVIVINKIDDWVIR